METTRGTCMDMCPMAEILFRKNNNLLHDLEENGKYVKQFSRSAAGRQQIASDLRPSKVLLKTMRYLIKEVLLEKDIRLSTIYEFVDDRIQAIRQDLTIQNIEDENAVCIIEIAIKFYIVFNVLLQERQLSEFDPVLNHMQLCICFHRLSHLYKIVEDCVNRNDFLAIFAAYNLGDKNILMDILRMQSNNYPIGKVFALNQAFMSRNFVSFFKIYKSLSVMLQLTCFRHLYLLRVHVLKVVCVSFSCKGSNFPFNVLCHWLNLSTKDAEKLCQNFSLKISDNYLTNFKKTSANNAVSDKVIFSSEIHAFERKIWKLIIELCDNTSE